MTDDARSEPTVAVVLPCKNEQRTIARCLQALRNQVPAPSIIIVVDNGSTDGSLEIARELADVVLEVPSSTISHLRNTGAAAAGDVSVLAFVDSDVEVGPGWLTAAVAALQHTDVVGSRMTASPDGTWVERRWAALEISRQHSVSHVWSGHVAMTKGFFDRIGGFNEAMATGEDVDLSQRVRDAGGTVALVPSMVAIHHGYPATLAATVRRHRWHISTPGWFARMSPKSRLLVGLAGGWTLTGICLGAVGTARRRYEPVLAWTVTSVAAVPALGVLGGRSWRHAAQDGTLLALWVGVRVLGLPRETRRLRGTGLRRRQGIGPAAS